MYKAIIINPFDIFFGVEQDRAFRKIIFDNKGANYLKTCLQNNTNKVYPIQDYESSIEQIKIEREKCDGIIVMASPYVQESFSVLLEHFKLPRRHVYTLSAAQDRRDVTFRDICENFELKPNEIAFYSAFTQEIEAAHNYGIDTYLFAPKWNGEEFFRGEETIAKIIRKMSDINF